MVNASLVLAKDGEESLAEQLKIRIEALIRSGKLSEGEKLPSFRQLSQQLQVSIGTVRQAVDILEAKGVLEVQHGRGVFVRSSSAKTRNIAFICPALLPSELNRILSGVNEAIGNLNVQIILKMATRAYVNEIEYILSLNPSDYDGCLIIPPANRKCTDAFQVISEKSIPFVLIDTIPGDMDANAVTTDCRLQGFMAVDHLIKKGHRKIAIADHNGTAVTNQLRRAGFEAALNKIGASLSTIPYIQVPITDPNDPSRFCPKELSEKLVRDVLTQDKDITAIVGIHSNMAATIMNVCQNIGLRVPDDISVIGLGDSEGSSMVYPILTIVDNVEDLVGMRAAKRLLEIIENKTTFTEKIAISPKLVENGSVKEI